jgi:hypothetical protein
VTVLHAPLFAQLLVQNHADQEGVGFNGQQRVRFGATREQQQASTSAGAGRTLPGRGCDRPVIRRLVATIRSGGFNVQSGPEDRRDR